MIYLVPTPIGNLEDISVRSLRLLTTTTLIFCEDTRVTKRLINLLQQRHNIPPIEKQTFISLHSHNEEEIIKKLNPSDFLDQDALYVSDAGMPGISDPGSLLVEFAQKNSIKYEVLPGANAALLALVSSGFGGGKFYFHGFLPHKSEARKSELLEILLVPCHTIIYESTHRILKLTQQLSQLAPQREIFIIKEATKKHETHFRGTAFEVNEMIKDANINGEFVVVIKAEPITKGVAISQDDIMPLLIPNKQKAKLLSKLTGISTNEWYNKLSSKDNSAI